VGWHLQPADGQDDGAERDVAHLGSLRPAHDRSDEAQRDGVGVVVVAVLPLTLPPETNRSSTPPCRSTHCRRLKRRSWSVACVCVCGWGKRCTTPPAQVGHALSKRNYKRSTSMVFGWCACNPAVRLHCLRTRVPCYARCR
jgi:hypothetical protein